VEKRSIRPGGELGPELSEELRGAGGVGAVVGRGLGPDVEAIGDEAGVAADHPVAVGHRQVGAAAGRAVLAVPPVAGEAEGLRLRRIADVGRCLQLAPAPDDEVAPELPVAAGDETRLARLLEDAEHPRARADDGVEGRLAGVGADEGDRRVRPDKGIADSGHPPRLIRHVRWPRVLVGAAAEVDGSPPSILEPTAVDEEIARAALGLDARSPLAVTVAEGAAGDDPTVAADHVDGRAAAAPALDGAPADQEVVHPRELDPVAIAAVRDIADREPVEDDVAGRGVRAAAIIDVQAVHPPTDEHKVAKHQVADVAEMQALAAAVQHRRPLGVGSGHDDGLAGCSTQPLHADVAAVVARRDENAGARPRLPERQAQLVRRRDRHVAGRRRNAQRRQEKSQGSRRHRASDTNGLPAAGILRHPAPPFKRARRRV